MVRGCPDGLRRFLKFRHFLRNAYAVSLDRARLDHLARVTASTAPLLQEDLRRFSRFLRDVRGSLPPD